LFKELGQKKMPNPPSHMEKEGESNVWRPQLMKGLQQKIWQKNSTHPFYLKRWVGQLIIKNKVQYVTSINFNTRLNIILF
jgi:hypothetical protein